MKKIIAMLLALVMVLGCLAACEKAPAEETKGTTPPKENKETTPVAPTQPQETNPALGSLPLTEEEVTLTIGIMQHPRVENFDTNDFTVYLEENTGINIEFKYYANDTSESVTQLNLEIAGNEKLPDILWGFTGINSSLMYELGDDGYFVDLKDYFAEYGYWFWEEYSYLSASEQQAIFQYGTSPATGAFYGFPKFSAAGSDAPNSRPAINTQWLEAVGAEMPTTVDELYDVLVKFATMDPNGNGKADEIPLLGSSNGYRTDTVQWIINAFVFCMDNYFFNATDGQLWVPYTTDEYRQAMVYLNKLYKEGLLSPLTYTISNLNTEYMALITPADGVPIVGCASIHPTSHYAEDSKIPEQITPMGALKAETELGGYAPMYGASYEYNCFVTTDCENPELAFQLLDFMCSQYSYFRQRYGVEGVHWEWAKPGDTNSNGDPAVIKVLDSGMWAGTNNVSWHQPRGYVVASSRNATYTDMSNPTYSQLFSMEFLPKYTAAGEPEEVVRKLIYNAEEEEYVGSVLTTIQDYVGEARAMFVSGVLDPNDDAAWNTYLSNLEAQGLSKLIETAQGAYTRMLSN